MTYYFRAALLLFFLIPSSLVLAQSNFYKMSGEAGLGVNYLYADANKRNFTPQFHIAYEYNLMRFISVGAKAQFGKTKGESRLSNDYLVGSFENSFSNYQFFAKANLGIFIPKFDLERKFWKYSHGLYAGVGIGGQRNRQNEMGENDVVIRDKSISHAVFIPFIFGYDYFLKNKENKTQWALSLNYQLVLGLDDELDGGFRRGSGSYNDFNNTLSLGLRYYFGSFGIDKNR